MITLIAQVAAAIAALAVLAALLWRTYWSPRAKVRRKAVEDGKKAVDNRDPSAITAAFDRLRRKKR